MSRRRGDDARRYGRNLAGVLMRCTNGTADVADADLLRRELDALYLRLQEHEQERRRRVRAGLGLARGSLDNLMRHNARPVSGARFLLIDGGRE